MVLDDFQRDAVFGDLHGLDALTPYVPELSQGFQGGDQVVAAINHKEVNITMHARNGNKARTPPARATWRHRCKIRADQAHATVRVLSKWMRRPSL